VVPVVVRAKLNVPLPVIRDVTFTVVQVLMLKGPDVAVTPPKAGALL
jgi:hypothetical protein